MRPGIGVTPPVAWDAEGHERGVSWMSKVVWKAVLPDEDLLWVTTDILARMRARLALAWETILKQEIDRGTNGTV